MRKLKILLLSALTLFSGLGVILGTLAWFQPSVEVPDYTLTGSSGGAYYAYGNGSEAKPYGIRTPKHLYNLAWLQYMGHYDDEVRYFELADGIPGDTLDMSGYVLPPIGSEQYPFYGVFNGRNKTISNITISGVQSELTSIPELPSGMSYIAPKILGFFGVVGALNDTPPTGYSSETTQMSNVTLDNISIKSPASATQNETLVGLAAGYVDGLMSGVKVSGTASIDLNGTKQSVSEISSKTTKLTDYALVGYTTKIGSEGTYSQKLSAFSKTGGSETLNPDWGDSIAFSDFNQRLFNSLRTTDPKNLGIVTKNTSGNVITSGGPIFRYYEKDDSKLTVYRGGSTAYDYFNSDPKNNMIIYNLMGEAANYGSTNPGTVIPLSVNDDYSVSNINTGYLTADSVNNTNGSVRCASYGVYHILGSLGDYATASYSIKDLYNSGNYKSAYSSIRYDSSSFEVLTNTSSDSDDGFSLIKDKYNSTHTPTSGSFLYNYRNKTRSSDTFARYTTARDNMHKVLQGDDGNGAQFAHGFHFYGTTSDTTSRVTYSNPYTIKAKINGSEYMENYPLPRSCVDFSFKGNGYITMFAGSYFPNGSTTVVDSICTLFKVNRNQSTHAITGLTEIKGIYKNPNYDGSDPSVDAYVYSSTTSKPSGAGDLVFDVTGFMSNVPVRNCVYYYEIPINAGEYAIGCVTGKANGAYILYLDIGTNPTDSNEDEITAYSITTIKSGNSYPSGVDFAPISVSGDGGDTIGVAIISGKQGVIVFAISSRSISVTDSSSIAAYSYRSNNYVASSPGDGEFTCNISGDPPSPSGGGTRVLDIGLKTVSEDVYSIRITDILSDDAGTIASSTYEVDSGSGYVSSTQAAIEALSTGIDISAYRNLDIVAALTRTLGTNEFVTSYDKDNCSSDTIDVDIETNGTTISIEVETGYTFKIGGVAYADGSTYSA